MSGAAFPRAFCMTKSDSALFEDITKLDEYYPTRTEIGAASSARHRDRRMRRRRWRRWWSSARARAERRASSSRPWMALTTYVPIDVSEAFLAEAAERLEADFDEPDRQPRPRRLHQNPQPQWHPASPAAGLFLRLDHRQPHPPGGARVPGERGAALGRGQRFPDWRRSREEPRRSDPRL